MSAAHPFTLPPCAPARSRSAVRSGSGRPGRGWPMSQLGRLPRFDHGTTNDRNRRALAVRHEIGEGRQFIRNGHRLIRNAARSSSFFWPSRRYRSVSSSVSRRRWLSPGQLPSNLLPRSIQRRKITPSGSAIWRMSNKYCSSTGHRRGRNGARIAKQALNSAARPGCNKRPVSFSTSRPSGRSAPHLRGVEISRSGGYVECRLRSDDGRN